MRKEVLSLLGLVVLANVTSGCDATPVPALHVPSMLDVQSVEIAGTPNGYSVMLTPQHNGIQIQTVLSLLENARVVRYEKSPLPQGGYPITADFKLHVGQMVEISPARSDGMVTRVVPNYVDYFSGNKPIRLYSPELYHWLLNGAKPEQSVP